MKKEGKKAKGLADGKVKLEELQPKTSVISTDLSGQFDQKMAAMKEKKMKWNLNSINGKTSQRENGRK